MRGRSLLKWASGLLQPAETKKEGLLPDMPPPSYEEACFVLHGASQAVAGAPRPPNPRYVKIINEAIAQADCALERLKQQDDSLDIVGISSRIRQLCNFAAYRVTEHFRRIPNTNLVGRREETQRETESLFMSIFATVDWEQQNGISVVRIATSAFRRTAFHILESIRRRNYWSHYVILVRFRNYWQARAGLHGMVSAVFRTAGLVVQQLAGDEVVAQSFFAVADSKHEVAESCTTVASL